jgi:phosphatidylinositol alpha-1,6-mannosyltransferase
VRRGCRFGPKRLLTVARLERQHAYEGDDSLIRAWPRVLAAVPDAKLVILGDGPHPPRLEPLAQRVGVRRTVFARVHQDDEVGRYANAAIFSLPSRNHLTPVPEGEGFGLVYMEAAAASNRLVALRGGAVDEVVLDGKPGLLVAPDKPEPLATAIIRLLEGPALAGGLGENGRQRPATEFPSARSAAASMVL